MPMTSEEFAALKRLIWNCIALGNTGPIASAHEMKRLRDNESAARAVLCGEQPRAGDAFCKFCGRQRYVPCMNTRDMSPIDGDNNDPICHLALKAAGGGERQEIGAAKPGEIEVTAEMVERGNQIWHEKWLSTADLTEHAALTAIYRAMRSAEPTRPVTDAEARAAIVELGGYLPTLKTMRAALEDFAKRRG